VKINKLKIKLTREIFMVVSLVLLSIIIIVIPILTINNNNRMDNLSKEISDIKNIVIERESQIKDFSILVNNFNQILTITYFGYAEPISGGRNKDFTAFSLFHNDKFYLITAGHCVEYESVKYTNFRFKSYNGMEISPNLIYYENDFKNMRDFAIFTSGSVRKGLYPDTENNNPLYILGNADRKINLLKAYNLNIAKEGESGSAVLNSRCRVVGVLINNKNGYTPIEIVLKILDDVEIQE